MYHFTGVVSVEHTLSLDIGLDSAEGGRLVHGARNLPNRVTLNVVESDTAHAPGWSQRMLSVLRTIKKNRALCRVVTPMQSYKKMLLTEITAREDGENACGWSGSLTFTQYMKTAEASDTETSKAFDNSSACTHTGTAGPVRTVSGAELEQLLARAGVER